MEQSRGPDSRGRPPAALTTSAVALILYEYPFNESIRTMLRLEHLFDRLGQLIARDTPVDHHYALATIFEIMDVGCARRPQVRPAEGAREAEAAAATATAATRRSPRRRSTSVLGQHRQRLRARSTSARQGRPGADRQRMADEHPQPHQHPRRHLRVRPAGLLRLAAARRRRARRADLLQWVGTLMPLAEALQVLLGLLRDSGAPQQGRRRRRPVPAEPAAGPRLPAAARAHRHGAASSFPRSAATA